MHANVRLEKDVKFIGKNSKGFATYFEGTAGEVEMTAPTPKEIMLQALGTCTLLDVVSILRKKRKTVTDLLIDINAQTAESHPKVFTKAHLVYTLISPDAGQEDLDRAVHLSEDTYCSISAMFKRSGCEITYETKLLRPE